MTSKETPGTLPLPRPSKAEMQVVIALDGGNSSGLKDADGIKLNGLGYLVRTNRSLHHNFVLIFGNAEEAYRFGTIAPHSIKHLLPNLKVFNPAPKKEPEPERSPMERMRRTREMLRRWGCIVHDRDGAGHIINIDD